MAWGEGRGGWGWGACIYNYIYVYINNIFKILLYNIGQGQWVSLVGLGEGRGWGGVCIYKYKWERLINA